MPKIEVTLKGDSREIFECLRANEDVAQAKWELAMARDEVALNKHLVRNFFHFIREKSYGVTISYDAQGFSVFVGHKLIRELDHIRFMATVVNEFESAKNAPEPVFSPGPEPVLQPEPLTPAESKEECPFA